MKGTIVFVALLSVVLAESRFTVPYGSSSPRGLRVYSDVNHEESSEAIPKVYVDVSGKVLSNVYNKLSSKAIPNVYSEANSKVYSDVTPKVYSEVTPKAYSDVYPKVYSEANSKVYPEVSPKVYSDVYPKVYSEVNPKVYSEANSKVYPEVSPKVYSKVTPKVYSKVTPKVSFETISEVYVDANGKVYSDVYPKVSEVSGRPLEIVRREGELVGQKQSESDEVIIDVQKRPSTASYTLPKSVQSDDVLNEVVHDLQAQVEGRPKSNVVYNPLLRRYTVVPRGNAQRYELSPYSPYYSGKSLVPYAYTPRVYGPDQSLRRGLAKRDANQRVYEVPNRLYHPLSTAHSIPYQYRPSVAPYVSSPLFRAVNTPLIKAVDTPIIRSVPTTTHLLPNYPHVY